MILRCLWILKKSKLKKDIIKTKEAPKVSKTLSKLLSKFQQTL